MLERHCVRNVIVAQSRRWATEPDGVLALCSGPGAPDPGAPMAPKARRAGAHQSEPQSPVGSQRPWQRDAAKRTDGQAKRRAVGRSVPHGYVRGETARQSVP